MLEVMRRLCVAVLALVLAGPAAASSPRSPVALGGMFEGGPGGVVFGSAPGNGELLRFIPDARFAVGVLLENTSRGRLVVTGAEVLEPTRTLVHQIGTQFHPWRPFKCPPGASCPAPVFPLHARVAHPRPFAVAPGKDVGVELDFRLGSCAQIPGAGSTPISRLRVSFRTAGGPIRQRVLALAGAELHLRMPKPEDCAQPRSSLSVDGPQGYSTSYDWTVPGSKGDVCTLRGHTLGFRSRTYRYVYENARTVRIEVRVPRFAGTGAYSGAVVTVVADGVAVFRSYNGVVTVTKATSHEVVAQVAAGHPPSPNKRGTPFRVYGTMRCRVVR